MTKSGCRFGEKCSYAHRQVDEQPSKRSKKNDDKSSVAMLKKHELHDRTEQPVVNHDKSSDRTWQHVVKRDTGADHRIHDNWVVSFRHGAAEVVVNFTEELRHAETNPTCKIHKRHCTSR